MFLKKLHATMPILSQSILSFVAVLCLFVLPSCVSSIYPLSEDEKDVVFREELLGSWKEKQSGEQDHIIVQKGKDATYTIKLVEGPGEDKQGTDTSYLVGKLVQVNNYLFMDCVRDEELNPLPCIKDGLTWGMLAPTHIICHVAIKNKNEVDLASMDYDFFKKAENTKKLSLHSAKAEDHFVLLEPGRNLKQLLVRLVREYPAAWQKATFQRI
jgi:hypothetical protein